MKLREFLDGEEARAVPLVVLERQRALEGRQVFSIIHDHHYFLINMPIYEDGMVDCWEMVDLGTMSQKIKEGWVSTSVPEGAWLSIFHLGELQVRKGDWRCKPENYMDFLRSVVREMNPSMENILVAGEGASKRIGNVNYGKLGSRGRLTRQDGPRASWRQYYAEQVSLYERVETGLYRVVSLVVYADGKIVMVGGAKPWAGNREDVAVLANEWHLHTEVPVGATVVIAQVGRFVVGECVSQVDMPSKLLEIDDVIAKLNGRPDSGEICAEAYEAFLELPSPDRLSNLRAAYGRVPEHMRMYILGDMDLKDGPIRAALGEWVWTDEEA